MKMKKILNEWRRFVVNEGVSNHDIRNKEIERIIKSNPKNSEAQRQIASIYLPMTLVGHIPIGAKEFYQTKILDSEVINLLETLNVAAYNHEETGEQSTESEYFTIETVGELANEITTQKIRVRSNNTSAAQGIFDSIEDLQRRIYAVQKMISQNDFDFSKLSSDFDLGRPTKGGYHRGPDSGDGGIQLPGNLTPVEMAEFEKMMQMYSEAHGEVVSSIGKPQDREHYLMLQRVREKQKRFYKYMYELWRDKKGEVNRMTSMYKSAAYEDEYDKALQTLLDASIVTDDRTPEQKELDETTAIVKILEKEIAELGKLAAVKSPKQAQAIKIYQDKQKEARAARANVQKARMKLRQATRRG